MVKQPDTEDVRPATPEQTQTELLKRARQRHAPVPKTFVQSPDKDVSKPTHRQSGRLA